MSHVGNRAPQDAGIQSSLPSPVVGWQTGSTGESVQLRLSVEYGCFLSVVTGKYGFRLQPEQARQLVRDLSAAVLASDVKQKAEADDAR
ncbi:hypothetical protein [Paraburkholderia sp. RL18-085-BIA-A]|uniref:hypothetical protein n=1 Tax=Paraburkholderia sp. RL18-085-BIA-A TaxID=3031633 RepID=UPI0038BD79FA